MNIHFRRLNIPFKKTVLYFTLNFRSKSQKVLAERKLKLRVIKYENSSIFSTIYLIRKEIMP